MGSKKSSGVSRGLFLDLNLEDGSAIEQVFSPKNQGSHSKHQDMPVKRVDNYTKESKGDKKPLKRGEQLRRR